MRFQLTRFAVILGVLTLFALSVRLAFFGSHLPTTDDYYTALTAENYMRNGQPFPVMPFHPVLRNWLTFASMELFGRGALSVKLFSVLFGSLLVPVAALLTRRATGDERAGLIVGLLVAIDIVLIGFSRQAIQEMHVAFFGVLGAWLAVEALRADDWRSWRWLVPLSGLAFGLGVSSKMYAVMPLVVMTGILAVTALRRRRTDAFSLVVTGMVALPLTVYLLTYLPWFGRGYDLAEWIGFQRATFEATITHFVPLVGNLQYSEPWRWFLVPLYSYTDFAVTTAGPQLAVAVGNPLVWLAVLPLAVYSLLDGERRRRDAVLHLLFWSAYLPLVFSPRPVWLLSAVSVVPFAFAILGSVVAPWLKRENKTPVAIYLTAVLVTTALLYPLAIGRALDVGYLRAIVNATGVHEITAPTTEAE